MRSCDKSRQLIFSFIFPPFNYNLAGFVPIWSKFLAAPVANTIAERKQGGFPGVVFRFWCVSSGRPVHLFFKYTLGLTRAHQLGQTRATAVCRCSSTVVKYSPRTDMREVPAGRRQRPSRRAPMLGNCRLVRATDECDNAPNPHCVVAWSVRKPMQRDRSSNSRRESRMCCGSDCPLFP